MIPPRPKRPIFPPANHYSMASPLPPAPKRKGPFPKRIIDHCKTCPKIYCSGWTIEISTYFVIWHCPKFTVQEKNPWGYIL